MAIGQMILLSYMALTYTTIGEYAPGHGFLEVGVVVEWIVAINLLLSLVCATIQSIISKNYSILLFAIVLNVGIALISYLIAPYLIYSIIFLVLLAGLFILIAVAAGPLLLPALGAGMLLSYIGVPILIALLALFGLMTGGM